VLAQKLRKAQPTLFEMEKPEGKEELASEQVEPPYSLLGLLPGISSFTAASWEGPFFMLKKETKNGTPSRSCPNGRLKSGLSR